MMRVYKDFLRRTLLTLLYYRELGYGLKQADSQARNVFQNGSRSSYASQDQLRELKSVLHFLDDGSFQCQSMSIDDMIDGLIKQLEADEQVGKDRDLVDTIVRIIGLPYARNVMSGMTLNNLRNAILLPDELVELKTKIREGMACMHCGHKFTHGEMSTFYCEPNNINSIGWCCTRCQKPTYMASETDIANWTSVSAIKGLAAAMKHKSPGPATYEPANPESFVTAANSILTERFIAIAAPHEIAAVQPELGANTIVYRWNSNPASSTSIDGGIREGQQ